MANWKTTVAGLIAAVIIALQTVMETLQHGTAINWYQIGIAFAIAALGILAKDINPSTPAIALLFCLPFLKGCASTKTSLVSATLSNGHTYPLVLEVTENTPFGVKLLAEFGATVQETINTKAAEYRKLYPKATITELMGTEKRTLN